MKFQALRLAGRGRYFFVLLFLGLTSCAAQPDLSTATLSPALSTPTPFLPEPTQQTPFVESHLSPLEEPTFTPFPAQMIPSESYPTPMRLEFGATDAANLTIYNPLTGLPVADPSLLQRRPLAIKVGNSPDYVRPQSGLTLADVVYEYYIEWGDSRFIAVFYGHDSPHVGPVRSGRYFDEHIAHMYDAFLIFKFADPRELKYLKASDISDFLITPGYGACPPFVPGVEDRDDYNNYFFDTRQWAQCAAQKGIDNSPQSLNGGFFSDEVPDNTLIVKRIYTYFSIYNYNYWQYDASFRKYFRYQEANDMVNGKPEAYAPLTDAETRLPVTADNVVVLFVPYTFANQFEAEDEVYHVDLLDYGNAYVFRDGVAIPAHWNRVDENQPLLLTSLLGTPIYLKPGNTFYEVIGVTSSYTQNGTDWLFQFATP
ncbi:MAG: DUF3048 domain-containing protein [Anaerolineales bacterium]|nr:DUF3048 domain-containing protein [Anaerolineales bacterium]